MSSTVSVLTPTRVGDVNMGNSVSPTHVFMGAHVLMDQCLLCAYVNLDSLVSCSHNVKIVIHGMKAHTNCCRSL